MGEDGFYHPGNDAGLLLGACHGIGLARGGLSVGQNGPVEALQNALDDALAAQIVNFSLAAPLSEYVVQLILNFLFVRVSLLSYLYASLV